MGPQGSGKDTQAKKIAKKYGLKHIATGDILRKHIKDKTPLGVAYENNYRQGRMASNSIIYQIVEEALTSEVMESGFILNGFPRNTEQLFWLYEKTHIDGCIYLNLPDFACKKRLEARGRDDDNPDAIKRRLADFKRKTAKLLKDIGKVSKVDATLPIPEVFKEIEKIF